MQKNKLKYLIISVFILAAINISLVAMVLIAPKPSSPDRSHMRKGDRNENRGENQGARFLTKQLALSKDQRNIFMERFKEHRVRKDSFNTLIKKSKSLLAQVAIGEVKGLDKDSLIYSIGQLTMKGESEMHKHFTELKEICTDEQLEKLAKVLAKVDSRRNEGERQPPPAHLPR